MPIAQAAATQLTPTGTLRAAINLGNPILAGTDPATGGARGVSVDLASALAEQLGVPLELKVVDTAAKSVQLVTDEQADIGFFAIDPLRGAGIHFTPAYVLIEGCYLVRDSSSISDNAEVMFPAARSSWGRAAPTTCTSAASSSTPASCARPVRKPWWIPT